MKVKTFFSRLKFAARHSPVQNLGIICGISGYKPELINPVIWLPVTEYPSLPGPKALS
jgi:hypothetical protein